MPHLVRYLTKWRYVHLFFSLLLAIAIVPFTGGDIVIDIALGIVLFSSLFSVSGNKAVLAAIIAIYFASQTVYLLPVDQYHDYRFLQKILNAAWILPVVAVITKDIITAKDVYKDMIFGGLCVYLFLGFAWAELYSFLLRMNPEAIYFATAPDPSAANPAMEYHLVYYSFVTLTTLGYGDIVPATEKAMALSVLESVCGQLFLAVFIASLVGRMVGGQVKRRESGQASEKPRKLD